VHASQGKLSNHVTVIPSVLPQDTSHSVVFTNTHFLTSLSVPITFSSDLDHALPTPHTLIEDDFDLKNNSKDMLKMDQGWIMGPQSQLLLWVPYEHQHMLYWPGNRLVIGTHATALDLRQFVHGPIWHHCCSHAAGKNPCHFNLFILTHHNITAQMQSPNLHLHPMGLHQPDDTHR
jgi:hypothetical protein